MSDIIKYTFCTPSMYLSNKKVYANFQPYLTLTFYKGNNKLSIQYALLLSGKTISKKIN